MSELARGDLEAIRELKMGIAQFVADASTAVRLALSGASRSVALIAAELSERREALRTAELALAACQADPESICVMQELAVQHARGRLSSAQDALRIAENALGAFQPRQARFIRESQLLLGESGTLLGQMDGDLQAYLASGATGAGAASTTAAGGRSTGRSAQMPAGWAMVSLAQIDTADSAVTGPESFTKGYSAEDLSWAFHALDEVVLPAMSRGLGADYFQSRDHAEGRIGTRSYSDTYSGFFGADSPIKLEARGDGSYTIANGYHRVWVARRLGLDAVPARLR